MFVLHVDPSDKNIVSLVSTYEVGQTVQINGPLKFKVETVVVESKYEGGIGGITRTYTNSQRNFFITNCTAAIHDESTYDNMTISELVSDYKARDVESCKKAKSGDASIVAAAPTITKKQTSLI